MSARRRSELCIRTLPQPLLCPTGMARETGVSLCCGRLFLPCGLVLLLCHRIHRRSCLMALAIVLGRDSGEPAKHAGEVALGFEPHMGGDLGQWRSALAQ